MTDQLIKLINENKSLSEICDITKLSRKQLFIKLSMLRQGGYLIEKQYNYNGEINYFLSNPFYNNKSNELIINSQSDLKSIRMILTSDSHYGHINENLECTDQMFNYCSKENIHLIFHLGDFFEGVIPSRFKTQKYNSTQEQIQETLSRYPYVPNILTVTCLGNHDASFWLDAGVDIKTILETRRHDIIPIGYEMGIVKINNYNFILKHPIERLENKKELENRGVVLYGHSHKFELNCQAYGNNLKIHIPSSSNIIQYDNEYQNLGVPSLIDAEFLVNSATNKITQGVFKQYILINNQLTLIGEQDIQLNIGIDKNLNVEEYPKKPKLYTCFDVIKKQNKEEINSFAQTIIDIANEIKSEQSVTECRNEEISEEEVVDETQNKVLTKTPNNYCGMSQIEKFNMRYGK